MENNFGLVGKKLGHSFSKKYFEQKFKEEGLNDHKFNLYEMEELSKVKSIIREEHLKGLSITIPYKLEIMNYCDYLSEDVKEIGAVNCINIEKDGSLAGHNTDWLGFRESLQIEKLNLNKKALVCGTGGASRAIVYALKTLGIEIIQASTSGRQGLLAYEDIDSATINSVQLIINCTHLGTFPLVHDCIRLPYEYINESHYCYDLVYNPEVTLFLKKSNQQRAFTQNGYSMLVHQAEAAWEIWNKE